jgi:hypothetical protein
MLAEAQLKILAMRAHEYALRVECGDLNFLDAVDMCQDAAEASGLTVSVGDDVVQEILAAAFGKLSESAAQKGRG